MSSLFVYIPPPQRSLFIVAIHLPFSFFARGFIYPLLAPIGFLILLFFCYFLVLGWFFSMPVCLVSPTCWSIVWLSTAAMPAPAPYKKIIKHLTKKAKTKANKVAKKCKNYTMRTHSSFSSKGCNCFAFPKGIFKKQAKRLCARSAARLHSQR